MSIFEVVANTCLCSRVGGERDRVSVTPALRAMPEKVVRLDLQCSV